MIGVVSSAFAKDMTEVECVNLLQDVFKNSKVLHVTVDRFPVSAEKNFCCWDFMFGLAITKNC